MRLAAVFPAGLAVALFAISPAAAADPQGDDWRRCAGNDPDAALQACSAILRSRPDFAPALNNRGVAYFAKGQYDRAIQDYGQAIRLKPDLAEPFNNRCLAYLKQARYDLATADFNQTIRLNKDYGNAMVPRRLAGPLP